MPQNQRYTFFYKYSHVLGDNNRLTAFICNRNVSKSATKLIISQHSIIYKFRSELRIKNQTSWKLSFSKESLPK